MNIGKQILSIRKEKEMSQEEFGKLFHVTRQTVSNWENEKSYPDLQTLVAISDMFNISLDVLLKEDKQMVKSVSKTFWEGVHWKKVKKVGVYILVLILIVSIVYTLIWYSKKKELEEYFNAGIEKYNFQLIDEGYYMLNAEDNIAYTLPNQQMPSILDFSLHFHASYLDASLKLEECSIEFRWSEMMDDEVAVNVRWNNKDDNGIETYYMDENAHFWTDAPNGWAMDKVPEEVKVLCAKHENEIKHIIELGREIYSDVYLYE